MDRRADARRNASAELRWQKGKITLPIGPIRDSLPREDFKEINIMCRILLALSCCLVFAGCQKAETPEGKSPDPSAKKTGPIEKKMVAKTEETAAKSPKSEAAPKDKPKAQPMPLSEERAKAIAGVVARVEKLS